MIVILGLILVVAAVVVGLAGVLTNDDAAHALPNDFEVFGYHVTGSTATVFLSGIVVGAIGMAGLALLLAGVRRSARRTRAARAERDLARRDGELAQGELAKADYRAPTGRGPAHAKQGWHLWGRRRVGHTP